MPNRFINLKYTFDTHLIGAKQGQIFILQNQDLTLFNGFNYLLDTEKLRIIIYYQLCNKTNFHIIKHNSQQINILVLICTVDTKLTETRLSTFRCVSVFFVEFQLHFEKDYSTTAWIHSLTDATTMLSGKNGPIMYLMFLQNITCSHTHSMHLSRAEKIASPAGTQRSDALFWPKVILQQKILFIVLL